MEQFITYFIFPSLPFSYPSSLQPFPLILPSSLPSFFPFILPSSLPSPFPFILPPFFLTFHLRIPRFPSPSYSCGEPAISLHSHHVSLVQWITRLLRVIRDPGSNPQRGYLCETRIPLLALSCYIGDPNVIQSLVLSTFRCFTRLCADNV